MKIHRFFKPIKITQATQQYGLQSWLETIYLIEDKELPHLSDWTVGYYHCKQCGAYQGFAYKIPEPIKQPYNDLVSQPVNALAHNEQLDFMIAHAHGDGRILMFEKHESISQTEMDAAFFEFQDGINSDPDAFQNSPELMPRRAFVAGYLKAAMNRDRRTG